VALIERAPHPNAAKVAANWLLSREGQMAYQSYTHGHSRRVDISTEGVRPSTMRLEGGKYIETDSPERRNMELIHKIVDEVWKKKRSG
jgi:ABC-type Fe3+ transport system substrate-binding protein